METGFVLPPMKFELRKQILVSLLTHGNKN